MFKKVFNLLIIIMVFGLLFLKKENTVFAQEIIPSDRRIDWSYAGIPGGIPNRTTICTTIDPAVYGNGTTDATAAIQTALNNCPNNQVVYLPPGIYVVSNTIPIPSYKTLRGSGPGMTTIKRIGTNTGSIIETWNGVWDALIGAPDTRSVTAANKDSKNITLSNTAGISVGDVLLLNQLNDNNNIDSVGTNGQCTFCGLANGTRSLGQFVEVTGVSGNQVIVNMPLHWTYDTNRNPWAYVIDGSAFTRWSGIENMTLTQDTPIVNNLIFLQGVQYFWVKNVELSNVDEGGLFTYYSIQSEYKDNHVHNAFSYSDGHAYGLTFSMYSSNNKVENNILETIRYGIETHGGASGNVLAYNYMNNIIYDVNYWLTCSPSINHGSHPKMNLWEGNIGYMAEGDFIWGSASHDTIFRSQSKGWFTDGYTKNNAAIRFAPKNYYMNVIGSILGTFGKSNVYEVKAGQSYNNSNKYIWVLGISTSGASPDIKVAETFYRHGNFDYVTNSTVWDPNNSNHNLPASLYLSQKPSWWCQEVPWPPIGPDVEGLVNAIPAQRRFENLPCTLNGNQTPLPTKETLIPSPTVKPGDGNGDGHVNELDYNIWRLNYHQNLTGASYGDFNSSGKVDGVDYVIWLLNFGN